MPRALDLRMWQHNAHKPPPAHPTIPSRIQRGGVLGSHLASSPSVLLIHRGMEHSEDNWLCHAPFLVYQKSGVQGSQVASQCSVPLTQGGMTSHCKAVQQCNIPPTIGGATEELQDYQRSWGGRQGQGWESAGEQVGTADWVYAPGSPPFPGSAHPSPFYHHIKLFPASPLHGLTCSGISLWIHQYVEGCSFLPTSRPATHIRGGCFATNSVRPLLQWLHCNMTKRK